MMQVNGPERELLSNARQLLERLSRPARDVRFLKPEERRLAIIVLLAALVPADRKIRDVEMDRLIRALEAIPTNVPPASPAGPLWNTSDWRNSVGRLQDQVSDSANRMIETLNRQTRAG